MRALDGLRGAAVLGVLGFHLATLDGGDRAGVLPGGWLGVDAFFTLSGYLITSLLLAEMGTTGRVDLRAFWRRRLRRLQPAALVAIVGIAATAAWWSVAGTGDAVRREALAALAGVANWQALWAEQSYAAGGNPSGFEHFWSLAVEEQFYLVWPALLAVVALLGGRRRAVLALALAGTAASWTALAGASLQRGYLGTDTRAGSVLVGAALAAVLPLEAARRSRRGGVLAGLGLAVAAGLWVVSGWPPNASLGLLLPVQAMATAAVLAGVVLAPSSTPARMLAWRPLAGIGRVSYGVYLWHWPVFVLCTPDRLGTGLVATTVIRLSLVAALVWLSWHLVEHPVRRDLVLRRTRLALPVAMAAVAAVAVTAVHGIAPAPAWAQADGRVVARSPGPAITIVPPPDRPSRVLVVGDSIPTSLLTATDATGRGYQVGVGRLLDQFAEVGIEAWGATITGCPVIEAVIVIDGKPWPGCPSDQAEVLTTAMAETRPDLVLWYARQDAHPVLLADGRLDTDPGNLEARIRRRLAWFTDQGVKVAFVSPGPNRDGHDAYAPLGSSVRSMAILDRILHRVAASDPGVVGVIRMAELLCGDAAPRGCPDRMPDGRFFRADDGVHFDRDGALVAGRWLVERVAALDLNRSGAAAAR